MDENALFDSALMKFFVAAVVYALCARFVIVLIGQPKIGSAGDGIQVTAIFLGLVAHVVLLGWSVISLFFGLGPISLVPLAGSFLITWILSRVVDLRVRRWS